MRKLILVLIAGVCLTATASAQRQTKLYVDNGSGTFTSISTVGNGGTITLPASGTILTTSSSATITGSNIASNTIAPANLVNNGTTASSTTFYEGDGKWGTPSGGVTPAYLNAYNTGFEDIPSFTAVSFPTVTPSAVGFTPSGGGFAVAITGIYRVDFSISPSNISPATPDFWINDNGTEVPGTEFDANYASIGIPLRGSSIISLTAGDVITLVSQSSSDIYLTSTGGSSTTASLVITRIQ